MVEEAARQVTARVQMLDVNCGALPSEDEPEAMAWLVESVQSSINAPLCIDSPDPAVLASGLSVHQGRPMINSISGERNRYDQVLPLAKEYKALLIALCMDEQGIPRSKEQGLEVGTKLIETLIKDDIQPDDIYLDPLV